MRTPGTRGIRIAAVAAVALAAMAPGALGASKLQRLPSARPELDVRAGERAQVPAATRGARTALQRRLGIEGVVSGDPVGGGLRMLGRTDGFLAPARAGGAASVALSYVRAHADAFGQDAATLSQLRLVARYTSNNGVTHLSWLPFSHGIPAYDGALSVHVAADGRVVAASGPPLGGLAIATATPRLSASQALGVAQRDAGARAGFPASHASAGPERRTTFANGDSARLVALPALGGDRLAWRLTVAGEDPYVYDELVDAATGDVLVRHSLTDFVSNASVFDYHPDAGAAHTVDIAPFLTSATTLSGPNAHAYADVNNDDIAQIGEETGPSSGTDWNYPLQAVAADSGAGVTCSPWSFCTWGGSAGTVASESTNRASATTQLFHFVNAYHNWLEQPAIGFDDGSHNFEAGGTGGSDPVIAEADDSILAATKHVNNANMSTPPDGQSPRMQMYLFTSPFPAVNGSDDASVVYHEYTHGLSNRLVDNGLADGLIGNQPEAMGEGWSDWYAMDDLVANGFVTDGAPDGQVVVGEYATGDTVRGIRNQALDCAVGSSLAACSGSATAGHGGGFTFADLGHVGGYNATTPRFEVHDDGEIWSETLWDLREALGATTARRLITDGMRQSPPDPSFLDERNAILQADLLDDGGAFHDAIWQVFAVRGMGFGADTTSSNATRGVASFGTPALTAAAGTFADDSAPLGDGDGTAEPGEAVHLSVALADPGLADLTHVHATLTSADAGVFVGRADADFGTIAAGDASASAAPFTVTLGSALACGAQVPFTLHVTSDEGALDVPLQVTLGSGRSVFSSSDGPHAIPDGAPTSTAATSTIDVPSAGHVDAPRVTIDIGSHAFAGDLTAQLTSPSGRKIDLLERPGFGDFGSGADWVGPITFRDDAGSSIQEIDSSGTLAGPYAPDEPLSAFAGEDRAGTWTLRLTDAATPDAGTLNGWSLDTDQPACNAAAALPSPVTGDATGVGSASATLGGTLDSGGAPTQAVFEYGTSAAYGAGAPSASLGAPASAPVSATLSGLAPGTTYHYRLDALRSGELIAVGGDRTFTTSATGSGAAGAGAAGPAGKAASPKPSVSHAARRLTLDRRNRFAFTFLATPAGLRGTVRLVLPKHRRVKALLLAGARFTTSRSGRVRLVIGLHGTALRRLRALHSATVTVTISLGGRRFVVPLKLSMPPPRHRRR